MQNCFSNKKLKVKGWVFKNTVVTQPPIAANIHYYNLYKVSTIARKNLFIAEVIWTTVGWILFLHVSHRCSLHNSRSSIFLEIQSQLVSLVSVGRYKGWKTLQISFQTFFVIFETFEHLNLEGNAIVWWESLVTKYLKQTKLYIS